MEGKAGVKEGGESSYPSPSMQSMLPASQQYPYNSTNGHQEQRAPSHGHSAVVQQAPLLPPIQQQFDSQTAMQAHHSQYAPMQQAPTYHPVNQYAHYQNGGAMQPAPMPSSIAQSGPNGMIRYPLPPQTPLDSRQMSGGRHKKEIKRRTKTGCLTCRKRRIKCDEAQPSCRNCAKSKRDCLGYDPIFKQSTGPAPIAAKPNATPVLSTPAPVLPSNPYTPQGYPAPGGSYVAAPHPDSMDQYGNSLDPALSTAEQPMHTTLHGNSSNLRAERSVRYIAVEELFSLNDIPPRYSKREEPPPISQVTRQEIDDFYGYHYAAGLDRLLETTWYTTQGLAHLHADSFLQDFVSQAVEQFKQPRADEQSMTGQIRSLEACLVWRLAAMPRANPSGLGDLIARIDTLENLLTGQFLDRSRLPSPPRSDEVQPKYNEQAFWHHLGRFVSIRDDRADSMTVRDVNDTLGAMRGILGMLENRDVLYSIAIARHIGGRMPEFHPQRHLVASTNDPNDEINKLKVAHQFVENEDQRGTTQVIQRICGMAIRGWALQKQ